MKVMRKEKKQLLSFMSDAEVEESYNIKKLEEVKKKIDDLYDNYLNQNILVVFFDIYGLSSFVIHCFIIAFYSVFMIFFSSTFGINLLAGFVGSMVCIAFGAILIVKSYENKLSDYFEDKFAFALRMISRNLSTGKTITAAIEATAKHLNGKLQAEFFRIIKQINAGSTLEEALQQGEKIYPYKGYLIFSANVQFSMQRGGSVKESLNELAKDLVSSQVIKRKTQALTSESRGAAKILAALPFIMLIILRSFAEENFNYLFTADYGRIIVCYVVISVTIGFVIIKRMIDKVAL